MSKSRTERGRTPAHQSQPPPPASNDVVPGRFNENDWGFMLEEEGNEEFVIDILQDIVNRALNVIHDKIIESRIIPYTVDAARELIIQTIEWQFMVSDPGESHPENDPTWLEDEEPSPAITDSWAQGAVPVMHLADVEVINEEDEVGNSIQQENADEKESSISSSDECNLDEEIDLKESTKVENEIPLDKLIEKRQIAPKPPEYQPLTSKKTPSRKVSYKPYSGSIASFKPITLTPVTDERAKRGHLSCNPSLDEYGGNYLASESLGYKNQRFPRSKDVTYDHRGNVISVQKLDIERLPSHRIRTKFSIIDPVEEEYKARLASKKNRYNFLRNDNKNVQTPATRHKPNKYKMMTDTQPMMNRDTDQVTPLPPPLVDTVNVSPGVVIREGGIVKRGTKKNSIGIHQADVSQLHPLGSSVTGPTLQIKDVLIHTSPLVRPLNSSHPLPAIPSSAD